MVNIFNLFLFLLTLWFSFMMAGHGFSPHFLAFGLFDSALVSFASFRLKLIDEQSELLYLSFGFYRHFCSLYFKNFFKSISLIIDLAILRKSLHPTLHKINFKENYSFNPALLISSLNMTAGLFAISMEDDQIQVHAIHEDYFYEFDILHNVLNLNNINDDNLV